MKKQYIKQNEVRKIKPEIYAEMHLVFDNDFDVNEITKETGILPFECQKRKETKINPLTQEHNPGFWTLKSKSFFGYDVKVALDDLLSPCAKKLPQIKMLCEKNNGQVIFDVVPSFCLHDEPTIYFDKEFIKIAYFLDAEIQLDMYAE